MKKNHWVAEGDYECATWTVKFFNTRMMNAHEFWQYLKKLLIAAEECEIMRIVETSTFFEWEREDYFNAEESGESYVDFFERTLIEQGKALFGQLSDLRVLSKLCYYDLSGQVVEEEMFYPAIALEKTRPGELLEAEAESKNAIELWIHVGYENSLEEELMSPGDEELMSSEFIADGKRFCAPGLTVHVYSDIWFPLVLGSFYDWPAKDQYHLRDWEERIVEHAGKKWFDNSELAMRHTPRFNDFIQRAKQLTLEYGGTWGIDVGTLHSMWNEDGIVLDIDQILQNP